MPARERALIKNHIARLKMPMVNRNGEMKSLREDVPIVGGMSAAIHVPLKIAHVFSPSHMTMSLTQLVLRTRMIICQKECHGVQRRLTIWDGCMGRVQSVAKIAHLKKVRI